MTYISMKAAAIAQANRIHKMLYNVELSDHVRKTLMLSTTTKVIEYLGLEIDKLEERINEA